MGLSIVSEDGKVHLWTGSYTSFDNFRKFVHTRNPTSDHPAYAAFFQHSDAQGFWSPDECDVIFDMLRNLFQNDLLDDDFFCEHGELLRILDGLSYCKTSKQNAIFL
jgi:hypothetical protein